MAPPRIVIAGASGFIGRPLCRALWADGARDVRALTRATRLEVPYAHVAHWDGESLGDWAALVDGADAVINLCGADIAGGRWTPQRKQELQDSRLKPTRALVAAMHAAKRPPRVFISASAVGYYGSDTGDEPKDETADSGADFLALLCADWEKEALRAPAATRTIPLRIGVVLAEGGGALRRLVPPFRLGLGGPIGTGQQWLSWIAREDVLGLIEHLLDADVAGPVNAVAPQAATNEAFSRALAARLRRPAALRLPGGVVKLAFGELADVLLGGQRVVPRKAAESRYAFKTPALDQALAAALS